MKRIYLLMILLIATTVTSFAQVDLVLTKTVSDTIKYNNPTPLRYYIIQWSFKNKGTSLGVTDKVVLKSAIYSSNLTLSLPPVSSKWPGGLPKDSTVYYNDTLGFKAAPNTNPFQWCDSAWSVNSSNAVIADANIADNKTCKTVYFKQDPLASVGNVESNTNGLTIYPNPASGTVNINYDFTSNVEATVIIRDMMGKVVITKNLGHVSGDQNIPVDISSLTSGMYFVELGANNSKIVSKFSVQ